MYQTLVDPRNLHGRTSWTSSASCCRCQTSRIFVANWGKNLRLDLAWLSVYYYCHRSVKKSGIGNLVVTWVACLGTFPLREREKQSAAVLIVAVNGGRGEGDHISPFRETNIDRRRKNVRGGEEVLVQSDGNKHVQYLWSNLMALDKKFHGLTLRTCFPRRGI